MRVVFCGGGTGGHVYPALTVAHALRSRGLVGGMDMLYIGVRGKMDGEIVAREGVEFRDLTAAPVRVSNPLATARGLLALAAGVRQAGRLLREFGPDVVFATGGYGSVGVGLAARLRRLPLLVFLPDVAAGVAVRTLARIADRIAVSVEPALERMPASKTVLTGYPVRAAFFTASRDSARLHFGLRPDLPVLLVAGGSTGARALNQNVIAWAPEFLRSGQLLHISGLADEGWLSAERQRLAPELHERYHLHGYLHEDYPLALAAADLAVMRAGASTLGELPAAGLPAVLVPGEFSDQAKNARYLETMGAAVMLPEADLAELPALAGRLLSEPARLQAMREAMGRLARPDAADRLADLVVSLTDAREPART